jgi:hypothetical protein
LLRGGIIDVLVLEVAFYAFGLFLNAAQGADCGDKTSRFSTDMLLVHAVAGPRFSSF